MTGAHLQLLLWRTDGHQSGVPCCRKPHLTFIAAPEGYQQVPTELQAQHIRQLFQSEGEFFFYSREYQGWHFSRWDKSLQRIGRLQDIKKQAERFYFPALCPLLVSAPRSAHVTLWSSGTQGSSLCGPNEKGVAYSNPINAFQWDTVKIMPANITVKTKYELLDTVHVDIISSIGLLKTYN